MPDVLNELEIQVTSTAPNVSRTINSINRSLDKFTASAYIASEAANKFTSATKNINTQLGDVMRLNQTISELSMQLKKFSQTVSNFGQNMSSSLAPIKDATETTARALSDLDEAIIGLGAETVGASEASEDSAEAVEKEGRAAKKTEVDVKKLTKSLARVKSIAKELFEASIFGKAINGFKGIGNSVQSAFKRISRVVRTRIIRTAIESVTRGFTESMQALYKWSTAYDQTFMKAMDSITTSMTYIRNTFGAMFAPIIKAIAPVFEYISESLANMFNSIQKTIAELLGQKTWTRAIRTAKKYIKVQLASFDEINNLSNDNNNYQFKLEDIELDTESFASRIAKAIKSGDFAKAGEELAKKFNSMITGIPSESLGEKIGKKINSALYFLKGATSAFDFKKAGERLGTLIGNAIKTIDWSALGSVIGSIAEGIFTMIKTALADTKLLKNCVNAISDFFKGMTPAQGLILSIPLLLKISSIGLQLISQAVLNSLTSSLAGAIGGKAAGAAAIKSGIVSLPAFQIVAGIAITLAISKITFDWAKALLDAGGAVPEELKKKIEREGLLSDILKSNDLSFLDIITSLFTGDWSKFDLGEEYRSKKGSEGGFSYGGKDFANGGYPSPTQGTMFIAGEVPGQAEMVGNINGRTGVASGREITGISEAVYSTSAQTNSLLSALITAVENKDIVISPSSALGRTVSRSLTLYKGVTG